MSKLSHAGPLKAREDALPPHSPTDEAGLLGSLVQAPERIADVARTFGGDNPFYLLPHRQVWDAMGVLDREHVPVDVVSLTHKLRDRMPDAAAVVSALVDASPGPSFVDSYLPPCRDAFLRRRILSAAADAAAQAQNQSAKPEVVCTAWRDAADYLYSGINGVSLDALLLQRAFSPANRPADPMPRFFIGRTPVCTPGNLTAVSASVKSGKSSFIAAMIASVVTDEPEGVDTFGIRARNPDGLALLHFDTEQSRFDHWQLITRALQRAMVDTPPPWFSSYSLAGLTAPESRRAIDRAIERGRKDCGGVFAVLVDGVADLVVDVNDAGESNTYTAHLHQTAIEHDCAVVCVIHTNPSSEKTRGHLGSQLERKSETNLRLEKSGEITVVFSDKNRRAPIQKENGPRFVWSDEAGMHVSTEAEIVKIGRPKDYSIDDMVRQLPPGGLSSVDWQKLCEEELGISRRSFYRETKALEKAGRVVKSVVTGRWEAVRK
jgi:hypothetical protein